MKPMTHSPPVVVFLTLSLLGLSNFAGHKPALCHAASASVRIEVLPHVTADEKRVKLLDLCDQTMMSEEWKNLLARDDIGASPAPGTEKLIQSEQLKHHIQRYLTSRGYDPGQVEVFVPDRIVVARKSIHVSKEQIESIFKDFVLSQAPWNRQDIEIRAIFFQGEVELSAGEMSYQVEAAPRERFLGNVGVTIHFLINGERERSIRVTGKVDLFQKVMQASRPLKRGEVVSDMDILFDRMNIADAPDRFAAQPDQVVGKRLLRDVGVRQPFNLVDLDQPLAFKRGTAVTIIYTNGALKLTAKGEAREDGVIGNTVRITNVMTKRTIFCRVVDETTVQAVP